MRWMLLRPYPIVIRLTIWTVISFLEYLRSRVFRHRTCNAVSLFVATAGCPRNQALQADCNLRTPKRDLVVATATGARAHSPLVVRADFRRRSRRFPRSGIQNERGETERESGRLASYVRFLLSPPLLTHPPSPPTWPYFSCLFAANKALFVSKINISTCNLFCCAECKTMQIIEIIIKKD